MGTRDDAIPRPAPRALQTLGAAIDMAVSGGVAWLWMRRRRERASANGAMSSARLAPGSGLALAVLREQLGSPGGWIVGLRTVDSRTGQRVALWRTLAVLGGRALTARLSRRLAPVQVMSDAERGELRAVFDRHSGDHEALEDELRRLHEQRRRHAKPVWQMPAGVLAAALVNRWLRRRLAPTMVIRSRGRAGELTARTSARSRRA
ncbi:MAG TPA: hypothetical protein VED41_08070 [Solirubrobacteraceae bacterium]|nr:hypothetical protein [Solirubrobacteraceae bacterium]